MSIFYKRRTFWMVLGASLILYFSFVGFWTGFVTKLRIQNQFHTRTGLTLEMGLFYFYPFTGNGYVKNVRIPNPDGFYSKSLISIEEIRFEGSRKTLYLENVMQLEKMHVQGIKIHFEPEEQESNFHKLYRQISTSGQEDPDQKSFKKIYISQLEIDPIRIVLGPEILNKSITLEPASIENVGTPEVGVGFYGFSKVLLKQYRIPIQQTLETQQIPLSLEMQNTVINWLDNQ